MDIACLPRNRGMGKVEQRPLGLEPGFGNRGGRGYTPLAGKFLKTPPEDLKK